MGKLETNKLKKQNALFETAFELFTTKGLAKTTISDIVDAAGVAKGTFYLYFKDKLDISNKLVAFKTGELFKEALETMQEKGIEGFQTRIHFFVDYMIDKLEAAPALTAFIYKNLSWGVFRGVFANPVMNEDAGFYNTFLNDLSVNSSDYDDPELMFFSILEMVSGSCYNCIIDHQPVTMEEYRPALHQAIDGILSAFFKKS